MGSFIEWTWLKEKHEIMSIKTFKTEKKKDLKKRNRFMDNYRRYNKDTPFGNARNRISSD